MNLSQDIHNKDIETKLLPKESESFFKNHEEIISSFLKIQELDNSDNISINNSNSEFNKEKVPKLIRVITVFTYSWVF